MVINDLENLGKVRASVEEKARWKKIFEDEATATVEIEALKNGEERICQILHAAQRELEPLNKKWPEKLMDFATGKDGETLAPLDLLDPKIKDYHKKKAKALAEHQERVKELQELIQDCRDALEAIQKKVQDGFKDFLREANAARVEIYRRRAEND